jgi:hypothetical protein
MHHNLNQNLIGSKPPVLDAYARDSTLPSPSACTISCSSGFPCHEEDVQYQKAKVPFRLENRTEGSPQTALVEKEVKRFISARYDIFQIECALVDLHEGGCHKEKKGFAREISPKCRNLTEPYYLSP